jgi:hypothetical protein
VGLRNAILKSFEIFGVALLGHAATATATAEHANESMIHLNNALAFRGNLRADLASAFEMIHFAINLYVPNAICIRRGVGTLSLEDRLSEGHRALSLASSL